MNVPTRQKGFTLIELIVVIVILGILAATALPKFIDLSGDAKTAKAAGVAGAVASSAAIQYSGNLVSSTKYGAYTASAACTTGSYMQGGALPTGCTGSLSGSNCTVTCDGVAAPAVGLP